MPNTNQTLNEQKIKDNGNARKRCYTDNANGEFSINSIERLYNKQMPIDVCNIVCAAVNAEYHTHRRIP